MKLDNFDFDPIEDIIIKAMNLEWDLHAFAEFKGYYFDVQKRIFSVEWEMPEHCSETNPWGCLDNHADGCRIHFKDVHFLSINYQPRGNSTKEDSLVMSGISKVKPNVTEGRMKLKWGDEEFNILISFQDESTLEIGAKSAYLEAVKRN